MQVKSTPEITATTTTVSPASNSTVTVPTHASTRKRTVNITYVRCFHLLLITKDVRCNNWLFCLRLLCLCAKPLLFKLVLERSVWKEQESKEKLEVNVKHKLLVELDVVTTYYLPHALRPVLGLLYCLQELLHPFYEVPRP